MQNIAFRRLREEFHVGSIHDFRHISVGTLDPVHKHLSVAFNGQLIAKLRSLCKVRLNGGASFGRHGEGERIGSGIIQCHAVDLPAGENVARGRHGLNGLLTSAEIHCLTIRVSGLAALHTAVLRVNGCNSGILEDDLARLQHSSTITAHDAELVLCPIPALAEGIP